MSRSMGLMFVLCGIMAGCGEPRYPYKEPQISMEKTLSGVRVKVSSDATGKIKELTLDPSSGRLTIKDAELSTQASPVLREFAGLMAQYAVQQQQYAQIRQVEWSGVNQLVSSVAPVVGQAIAGQQSLSALRMMRPKLAQEALSLLNSGQVDPQEFFRQLPPDIVPELMSRLEGFRRIAATQPAGAQFTDATAETGATATTN